MSTTTETQQPASFAFSSENAEKAKAVIAKYPEGRQASAVMPLLDLAQRQNDGWLPRAAIEYVAAMLDMPVIRAMEVATFYTMYNLEPVGENFVQVCTTTPCWLRGSDEIVKVCEKTLGVSVGSTTPDGKFTLIEVECLGACVNAPMMQINDDYYEDLDADSTERVLNALKRGETPKAGPQGERHLTAPAGGPTTLAEFKGAS
jgi:NADH-quinone oxidoreductase subunit E